MNFIIERTSTRLPELVPEVGLIPEWLYLFSPTWNSLPSFITFSLGWDGKSLLSYVLHSAKDVESEGVQLLPMSGVLAAQVLAHRDFITEDNLTKFLLKNMLIIYFLFVTSPSPRGNWF